ncbi:Receptor-like protein kinase HSL1 [Dichanthelium oligosanthes]|uniref:Receptor-like protein kinase HSL1 n=1 Tax=Dichanthelium oligosanthes TaxID=888268 RepID=A0A1E5VH92_9POAL|nr:Receptor-like protein kinase HSL1 [Dichanthelium oligosanthes]
MASWPRCFACLRVLSCICLALTLPCPTRRAAAQPGAAEERQRLLQIKRAWGDPEQLASWGADGDGTPHCNWTYVSCDAAGRVASLALPNVTLAGAVVPDAIGGLADLKVLNLYNTSVVGGFPKFLYSCTGITRIDLPHNQLEGELPADIGRLGKSLTYLALHYTNFTGEIPAKVSKLKKLRYLALNQNQLTGTIPPELGELTNLETLKLEQNSFSRGKLRESKHWKLDEPDVLELVPEQALWTHTGKYCSATIVGILVAVEQQSYRSPPSGARKADAVAEGHSGLASCPTLIWLDLHGNELSGEVPAAQWTETKLINLQLKNNGHLTGTLPKKLYWNLTRVSIENNRFTGHLPVAAAQLKKFYIANNLFSGSIPADLVTGMPLLKELNLAGNQLSGVIP